MMHAISLRYVNMIMIRIQKPIRRSIRRHAIDAEERDAGAAARGHGGGVEDGGCVSVV
jgi:hypothetical protein